MTASFAGADLPNTATFTFTVPSNAIMGTTRMRVTQQESGSLPLDPCASFTWGSVADFNVQIGAPACIVTAPYTHGFENGGAIDPCWTQSPDNDFDWSFTNTSTPSGNTGTGRPQTGAGHQQQGSGPPHGQSSDQTGQRHQPDARSVGQALDPSSYSPSSARR